jgi:hypothetical protein
MIYLEMSSFACAVALVTSQYLECRINTNFASHEDFERYAIEDHQIFLQGSPSREQKVKG